MTAAEPQTSEHTPTPWKLGTKRAARFTETQPLLPAIVLASFGDFQRQFDANADFIVTACNSHDELVSALRGMITASDQLTGSGEAIDKLCRANMAAIGALLRAGEAP